MNSEFCDNIQTRRELPPECLIALGVDQPRPWPETPEENCREYERRLEAEAAGDPLVERYAKPRKEREAAKVLQILDQLERGSA